MMRKKKTNSDSPAHRARSRGRPPKYNPDFHPQLAKKICEGGATIAEVADTFGVSMSTIYQWRNSHPAFNEACEVSRERAEKRIERTVFDCAVGYIQEVEKPMVVAGKVKKVTYREHVPPSLGAAKFLLSKYNPEKWGEKSPPASPNPLVAWWVDIKANVTLPGPTEQPALPAPVIIDHEPPEQDNE